MDMPKEFFVLFVTSSDMTGEASYSPIMRQLVRCVTMRSILRVGSRKSVSAEGSQGTGREGSNRCAATWS